MITKYNFNKGQNGDVDPRLLGEGEYLNLQNGRVAVSERGRGLRIENTMGTVQISQSVLPPYGINYPIGSCVDEARDRIIYFMCNTNGDNGIYCYDIASGVTYAVLYDSQVLGGGLIFDRSFRIDRNAKVVGDLLYWTDNYNQPRRVNIEAGIKMNHAGYVTDVAPYSYPMRAETITLIRKPPNYTLTTEKKNSADVGLTLNNNQIKNDAFYFGYFYTYRDGEQSTMSARSVLVPYNTKTETYDVVQLQVPFAEYVNQDVQKVTIVVIYATNQGAGFEVKTWNKSNTTDLAEINAHNAGATRLTFNFTNSEVGAAVNQAVITKPFDSVPLVSETLEVSGNRVFLARNRQGYTTPAFTSLTATLATTMSEVATVLKSGSSRKVAVVFYDKYMRQCGVVETQGYITVPERGFTFGAPYNYAMSWALSNANAEAEIPDWAHFYSVVASKDLTRTSFMQSFAGLISYAKKDSTGEYKFDSYAYSVNNEGVAVRLNVLAGIGMGYSFNAGDVIKVNSIYGSTVTSATLAVKAVVGDYLIAENYNFGDLSYAIANFEIYTPTVQASGGNYYEQGTIYPITNPELSIRVYSSTSGLIAGDAYVLARDTINNILYDNKNAASTDFEFHTLKCQLISASASSTKYNLGSQTFAELHDLNTSTNWFLQTTTDAVDFNIRGRMKLIFSDFLGTNEATNFKISVWYNDGSTSTETVVVTPRTLTEGVQYTFDFQVDITVPAGCRVFLTQQLDIVDPIQLFNYTEGAVFVTALADSSLPKFETMSPNDKFWQNWFTNAGRIQIKDDIGQQQVETGIRWSNVFAEGTRSNGLSSFDALDQKILSKEVGAIRKLQVTSKVNNEQGNVMLAVCENDAVSMYMGETQLVSQTGNAFVAQSDGVIGSVNTLKGGYGTINPESVVEHDGLVFWLSMKRGVVAQYAENGLVPVSDYGMARFWQRYCKDYIALTQPLVYEWNGFSHITFMTDPFHKELLCVLPALNFEESPTLFPSYSDVTPAYASSIQDRFDIYDKQAKTMCFSWQENAWKNNYQAIPDWLEVVQNKVYGFKNAKLWIHDSDEDNWNTWYGTQYPLRIWFSANVPPSVMKDLFSHSVQANVVPDYTVAMAELPYEQITDLTSDDYTTVEGVAFAKFLRDRLSPSVTGSAVKKMNFGDLLKGEYHLIMCEFRQYEQLVYVNFINVEFAPSKGLNNIIPQ